jgi:hypothetical protein
VIIALKFLNGQTVFGTPAQHRAYRDQHFAPFQGKHETGRRTRRIASGVPYEFFVKPAVVGQRPRDNQADDDR